MPRGRKPKEEAVTKLDDARLLKQLELQQRIQLESLYKDLAKIKHQINEALTRMGFMDECGTIAEAAFKAGRAYGPLDEANDKLEEILENIYSGNDLDHWDDILQN